jgi:hypothetical protein
LRDTKTEGSRTQAAKAQNQIEDNQDLPRILRGLLMTRTAGMRPARLMVPILNSDNPRAVQFSKRALEAGLIGLMLQNIMWLMSYPETPKLYASGVKYVPEMPGYDTQTSGEDWKTIPYLLVHGYGDCEDLASWRAAELRMQGIRARPIVKIRQLPGGSFRAHAIVRLPGGQIEDPSAKLGMYKYAASLSR